MLKQARIEMFTYPICKWYEYYPAISYNILSEHLCNYTASPSYCPFFSLWGTSEVKKCKNYERSN